MRPRQRTRPPADALRPLVVLAVVTGALVVPPETALASCAAPSLAVSPAVAAPGQTLAVTGQYFADGCSDTGGPPSPPTRGISLSFAQPAGNTASAAPVVVGEVDARDDYTFRIDVVVPPTAPRGSATLTATAPSQHPVSASVIVQSAGSADELPRTGRALAGSAVAALLVLVSGVCLTCAGRRRSACRARG